MSADLTNPVFTNEEAAMAALEASRWPDGPFCPHCGSTNVHRMAGKTQAGMFLCNDCRDKFSPRVGTVLERSHVPVHKWLLAIHLLTASKKGMSAHQLHRMLGVTYKTAWFMAHRVREAMKGGTLAGPLGGEGKVIEADELYIGKRETPLPPSPQRQGRPYLKRGKSGPGTKRVVFALVERGGETRMFHIEHSTAQHVRDVVVRNISRESALHTDESKLYTRLGEEFAEHRTVHHASGEYVRYDDAGTMITTNTVENVFSVFRRGMHGTYQHCGEAHLHRYLAEFEFRHNRRTALGFTDKDRAAAALKGIEGKRLTYRRSHKTPHAYAAGA